MRQGLLSRVLYLVRGRVRSPAFMAYKNGDIEEKEKENVLITMNRDGTGDVRVLRNSLL